MALNGQYIWDQCEGTMGVVIPEKNIDAFLALFLKEGRNLENIQKERKFFETCLIDAKREATNDYGMVKLLIDFKCEHSVTECLLDVESPHREKKNTIDHKTTIDLNDAIVDFEIKRLILNTTNDDFEGKAFEEHIEFDNRYGAWKCEYETRKMYKPSWTIDLMYDDGCEEDEEEDEEEM